MSTTDKTSAATASSLLQQITPEPLEVFRREIGSVDGMEIFADSDVNVAYNKLLAILKHVSLQKD